MKAEWLTCSSLTIIKHKSLSKPFRPKVPKVVWISEKSRLLVTSWWVFISYQVFSWSMWHVILEERQKTQNPKAAQNSSWEDVGRTRIWGPDIRDDSYGICLITSVSRHPAYLMANAQWAREAKFSEITVSCPVPGHWLDSLISTELDCCSEPRGEP